MEFFLSTSAIMIKFHIALDRGHKPDGYIV